MNTENASCAQCNGSTPLPAGRCSHCGSLLTGGPAASTGVLMMMVVVLVFCLIATAFFTQPSVERKLESNRFLNPDQPSPSIVLMPGSNNQH